MNRGVNLTTEPEPLVVRGAELVLEERHRSATALDATERGRIVLFHGPMSSAEK